MGVRLILSIAFSLVFIGIQAQEKPKKPHVLYEEADLAYNDGKYTAALQLLNECLTINPAYYEAYSLRAAVKDQLKDLDGALTDYSIFLEKVPNHPEVLMSRAVLRYKLGFYDQAKEDFSKLLQFTAGETNAVFYKQNMSVNDKNPMMTAQGSHKSYVYNYMGLTAYKLKDWRTAIVYFDSAIRLDAIEADYFVNRGLAKENIQDSTAFVDYERALRLDPTHTLAQRNLAALNAKKLQHMTTEERLTLTIKADSTMLYPYLERAQQRYESGYYKGALDDYNSALALDSNNVEIWLARALTREKLKDHQGAFSDYTKAIDLKENYAKAWLNRGNLLLRMERYNDAIEDYNVALIYYSDYALAYYNRALAKVRLKKNNEACSDLKQAEAFGMKVDTKIKSKVCGNQ